MDCLFCKIINGEVPAQVVYEDKSVLAFLDLFPSNPGHVLVVPKKHCENLLDASGEDLRSLISVIPKIAAAALKSVDCEGFNLAVNNGKVAGQVIPHLHFHIVPRIEGDGHELFHGTKAKVEDLEEIKEKLRRNLREIY
ncbi:MAG TPA: HIT family protein [Patescibacteria group bacterium]|nr:HIT family protein [Patescibacteria group bacterium]